MPQLHRGNADVGAELSNRGGCTKVRAAADRIGIYAGIGWYIEGDLRALAACRSCELFWKVMAAQSRITLSR